MAPKMLQYLTRLKIEDIKYIVGAYERTKQDFFEISKHLLNSTESEKSVLFKKHEIIVQQLRFYYQDFYIHTIILCDLIARTLTNNCYKTFPSLIKELDNISEIYKKAIIKFKPFQEKIRYWRNKLIIHQDIVHPFGSSIRFHPRGDIEFLVSSWKPIEEQDLKYLYKIRDHYSESFPELRAEMNFWELMILFDRFPINLSKIEEEQLHNLRKKYGGFLPKIEEYIQAVKSFITELNLNTS